MEQQLEWLMWVLVMLAITVGYLLGCLAGTEDTLKRLEGEEKKDTGISGFFGLLTGVFLLGMVFRLGLNFAK